MKSIKDTAVALCASIPQGKRCKPLNPKPVSARLLCEFTASHGTQLKINCFKHRAHYRLPRDCGAE